MTMQPRKHPLFRLSLLLALSTLSACATTTPAAREQAALVPPGGAPCTDANWHWSTTQPRVNRLHVFCGEIGANNTPKGFHSRQLLADSAVVTAVNNIRNQHQGLFDADVDFTAPAQPHSKFSTFFPDACTVDQVTASVVYAANNQAGPAPGWGVLGPSAPPAGGAAYCLDSQGAPFVIRMGLLGNGDVNTAFPN
jgi:hypothetical protein